MTATFDFGTVENVTEATLTAKGVQVLQRDEIADFVMSRAQASLDEDARKSITFAGNLEAAKAFERQMRSAGHYTSPEAGMTVSRPDDGVVVFYRASKTPRGRKPGSSGNGAPADSPVRAAGGSKK